MTKTKKGIAMPFNWMFAIIAGVIILFIAIYKTNEFNNKWIALFMIYILQMQLLEAIMWLDQNCEGYNQKASLIAYFFTIYQPLVNYLVMLYIVGWTDTTKNISLLMIPYFISSIYYIYQPYYYPNQFYLPLFHDQNYHHYWQHIYYHYHQQLL